MKIHVKNYYKYFGLTPRVDVIYDEYEWIVNNREVVANQIHHIEHGANKWEGIENYMGLTFDNHDLCHNRGSHIAGDFADRDRLKEIHLEFMNGNNPY